MIWPFAVVYVFTFVMSSTIKAIADAWITEDNKGQASCLLLIIAFPVEIIRAISAFGMAYHIFNRLGWL